MNHFTGEVFELQQQGHIILVKIQVSNVLFSAILIDDKGQALALGQSVSVIFKETEVILGKGDFQNISLQNRIPGEIKSLEEGKVLSKVILETDIGEIISIITVNAVRNLGLHQGEQAVAMIKSNEIMLSHD